MPLSSLHRVQPRLSPPSYESGRNPGQHAIDRAQPDLLRRSDAGLARGDRGGPSRRIRCHGAVATDVIGREEGWMTSLVTALKNLVNREVAVWLNHPEFKVIAGRLVDVQAEHVELRVGDSTYYIPCGALVAVRPNA